ncbi:MAG: phasin [Hyphomicrobiales bacterium]
MNQSAKKAAAAATEQVETASADLREMTERGLDQAKAAYDQFKGSAQEAVDLLDGSTNALKTGGTALNMKAIEFAQTNINAGFDFARQIASVNDVQELVELQSKFARDQFAAYTKQARDLGELSVKVAEGASKPLAEGVKKSLEQAKQVFPQA